ncbi:hypothetical protein PF008_g33455 [Phytophthora fragariae]|uniref:Secreted protein n=1 Tax=Phytophthora fragariae TaxID=53985 RepID=A0A6G0PWV1_9STRA|nr:hypothetical protein PF008_g33455 [Phytophthora fragariae]
MHGKPRVHAVHLWLPTDCCALFCVPPALPGSRADHCRTATMTTQQQQRHCRGRCTVSRACMRFICGCLLTAVPCFACHQPCLEAELATAAPPP